jgi:malonyl-CoA O-methyltransferase
MKDDLGVDRRDVRCSFERAAATYDEAAVLQNEVCRRMLARLDLIRLAPATVLDAGSGTGNAVPGLLSRYPGARVVALDLALEMARRTRARRGAWRRWVEWRGARLTALCADMEALPLRGGSIDLVWSNLALQWLNEPGRAFAEMARVLRPGGLLMFSSFGPDTLKELRAAYGENRHVPVHRFVDMHDLGDCLLECGYADPVMDVEVVTLTYRDVRALMRDLKAIGAHNLARGRPRTLTGTARFAAVVRNYEALRREGRLPATFEIVYGHAWKPLPRMSPTGHPVIDIKPGQARL